MVHVRRCQPHLLGDESGTSVPDGRAIAIYSLTDPRDLRTSRYIGQTRQPARRHLQHLRGAQPWRIDQGEEFWWHTPPRFRALYAWIRDLWQAEALLPALLVHEWVPTLRDARYTERRRIADGIGAGLALFNIEALRLKEMAGSTRPLPFNDP